MRMNDCCQPLIGHFQTLNETVSLEIIQPFAPNFPAHFTCRAEVITGGNLKATAGVLLVKSFTCAPESVRDEVMNRTSFLSAGEEMF